MIDANPLPLHLVHRYLEPHRKYHTLVHIAEMLDGLYDLKATQPGLLIDFEWDAVFDAVWYHDAVYVPGRADNEEQSATLARIELRERLYSQNYIELVSSLVISTRLHNPQTTAEKVLSDLDMAILAANSERYDEYVRQVRDEFGAFSFREWLTGRGKFLQGTLDSKQIFHTPHYYVMCEGIARHNLRQELDAIR